MFDESSDYSITSGEEIDSLNENIDTFEDTFFNMLLDSDESPEKKQDISMNLIEKKANNIKEFTYLM